MIVTVKSDRVVRMNSSVTCCSMQSISTAAVWISGALQCLMVVAWGVVSYVPIICMVDCFGQTENETSK